MERKIDRCSISLKEKADWIREQTIKIHKMAPETRLASSLSCIEILTVLYYGKILNFDSSNPNWEERDRLIISKAHGAVSLYPILSDLGFFDKKELENVCKDGSTLGSIPDCSVKGIDTINGSLGHGLGVACGIAIGLKRKNRNEKVFVLCGDGELFEGSVWESIMFASHHKLDNLILIIDKNKISMLGPTKDIIDLEPLENKFKVFKWDSWIVNGHDTYELFDILKILKNREYYSPKVLIANTIKGKGVKHLENDPLCHVKSLR